MFLGHFGLAFAAKKIAKGPSLGTTIAAAQFPDILWPLFLATGLERVVVEPGITPVTPFRFESYPFSHSLLAMTVWGTLFGLGYFWKTRERRGAWTLGALVVSHFVLDVIVHIPDVPLWPGTSPLLGLGLWRSWPLTILSEAVVFGVGVAAYAGATSPRDGTGRWGFVGLVGLLVAFYLSAVLGPPPPSQGALIIMTIACFAILIPFGAWVDRHRTSP